MYHYVLRFISRSGADVKLVCSVNSCANEDDVHYNQRQRNWLRLEPLHYSSGDLCTFFDCARVHLAILKIIA